MKWVSAANKQREETGGLKVFLDSDISENINLTIIASFHPSCVYAGSLYGLPVQLTIMNAMMRENCACKKRVFYRLVTWFHPPCVNI